MILRVENEMYKSWLKWLFKGADSFFLCRAFGKSLLWGDINSVLLYGAKNKQTSSAFAPVAIQLINNLNFKFKFV